MEILKIKEIYDANEIEWNKSISKNLRITNDDDERKLRVIIYGAGRIGKQLNHDLRGRANYEIVLWVDKDFSNMSSEISTPEEISNVEYDYIIVAVINQRIANEIVDGLKARNIQEEKIVLYETIVRDSELDRIFKDRYKSIDNVHYWENTHELLNYDRPFGVTSMICNQSFFDAPFVQFWADKVHDNFVDLMRASNQLSEKCLKSKVVYHRKLWEFIYICQGLYERGMLGEGKKGVAFGIGTECLPDLFASMGCEILATDLNALEAEEKGWIAHAENIGEDYWKLNQYGFCNPETFKKRVKYQNVNMNHIPDDIQGYDFCWSACALEHIGGIQAGLEFIKNSLKTLKSGGIAIHTTEYNLYSNERTFECEGLSLFRRKDIERLINELKSEGNIVYPMDWHVGENVVDDFIDIPPYSKKDMHLRLKIQEFPCTSIGLIIQKATE